MRKSIFNLNNREPIIVQFIDNNQEEIVISEVKISHSENTSLYDSVIDYFKAYGYYTAYFRNSSVATYIDGVYYFKCDISTPNDYKYHQLFGIFILNFGPEIFIRKIRDLEGEVEEPVLRLYIPYNEKDLDNV
ncbi:hypothetical protein ACWIUA_07145 [Ursidibacter sp. B-7004-1]